jgi:predicted DNA-binding antitoxin AbrB/MazE fold protein
MTIHIHATYRDGLIHPDQPLNLPDGAELRLTVETLAAVDRSAAGEKTDSPIRIYSPRLAHPEQLVDFQMDVQQISDAGV